MHHYSYDELLQLHIAGAVRINFKQSTFELSEAGKNLIVDSGLVSEADLVPDQALDQTSPKSSAGGHQYNDVITRYGVTNMNDMSYYDILKVADSISRIKNSYGLSIVTNYSGYITELQRLPLLGYDHRSVQDYLTRINTLIAGKYLTVNCFGIRISPSGTEKLHYLQERWHLPSINQSINQSIND